MEIDFESLESIYDSNRYYMAISKTKEPLFIKIKGNEKDAPLEIEYANGIQINQLQSPFFLRTYHLQEISSEEGKKYFPYVSLPFPRKILVSEYSPHLPIVEYLRLFPLSDDEKISILIQITCIIWHAYEELGFIHNDLNGGNLLLEKREKIDDILIGKITLHTPFYCRIYDYGRSFFIQRNEKMSENKNPLLNDLRKCCYSILGSQRDISYRYVKTLFRWNFDEGIDSLLDLLSSQFHCEIRTDKIVKILPSLPSLSSLPTVLSENMKLLSL